MLLPLFGTLDVDHLFHSSGWENDVPHKILNGQWNNEKNIPEKK
jgi:hypothetical protein